MRHINSAEPLVRLHELLVLIGGVLERRTALEMLESILRYYVQGTQRLGEEEVRVLLAATPGGDQIMQTFIEKYIDQGHQEGEALVLLRLIKLKFGAPSAWVRQQVGEADAETLLRGSERVLYADTLEAVFQ